MASRGQFLDDYEISLLVCDSDDSEDDRHNDDDIGLSGSEDEEIWVMYDCATKYMMNAKVYLGKGNSEVASGLASDVVCTLLQPFSGQDRGGRNVTTGNFFTSVDLENQLKNKKLTLFGAMKQNKREIPQEFNPARQRDENSSIFGFTKELTLVSYVSKKNKSVVLLSSLHHDSAICSDSGKPKSLNFITEQKMQ